MIPKMITLAHIPFTLSPMLQAQILYNITTKSDILLQHIFSGEHLCSVHVTQNNIVLEYDCNEIEITCKSEWIQVMYALNNVKSKDSILKVFVKSPEKLLLIIDVVLSIHQCDIINIILGIIFDQMQEGKTYDICTYINNNGAVES